MPTFADYDAVPYEDCPLPETHPDSLSIIGRLFNIDVAPVEHCRVLELGCAAGGNLIPMAYHWPGSEFVGVELSERQAERAQYLCGELALNNIRIIQGDILALDSRLGCFDYIITHGVFSWVPKSVQDQILRLCRTLLNPNGIAYISYNTLPGWNLREPIRHMMLYNARHAPTREARMRLGVEALGLLANGLSAEPPTSIQAVIKQEVMQLIDMNVSYLMHDYMEVNNVPLYFHQFMERAEACELQYLADTNLYSMLAQGPLVDRDSALDNIENLLEYEQYMDFFTFRFFRQSLLTRAELDVVHDVAVDKMQDWYLYASFNSRDSEVDLLTDYPEIFIDNANRSFTIHHPLTKAAVVLLSESYPNGYSYRQLSGLVYELVSEHGNMDLAKQAEKLLAELFALYISGGLRLSMVHRDLFSAVSAKPMANHLVRVYSLNGLANVASVHHQNVVIDAIDRFVLERLDGEHTVEQVCDALHQRQVDEVAFKEQLIAKGFEQLNEQKNLVQQVQQLLFHYAVQGLLSA